jgi:hypothetical protein
VDVGVKENPENGRHKGEGSSDALVCSTGLILSSRIRNNGESVIAFLIRYHSVINSRYAFIGGVADNIEEAHLLCMMKPLVKVAFDSAGDQETSRENGLSLKKATILSISAATSSRPSHSSSPSRTVKKWPYRKTTPSNFAL